MKTNFFLSLFLSLFSILSFVSCNDQENITPDSDANITSCMPTAVDDHATTTIGSQMTVSVLANDSISCGSATVTILSGPQHGSAHVVQGQNSIVFTPAAGYTGPDQVLYQLCIGDHCVTAILHIMVNHHLCQVAAFDDHVTINTAGHHTFYPTTNDTTCHYNPIQLTITSGPSHGSYTLGPDNAIIYTPNNNFTGTDQITYQICANGQCSTATVHFTVTIPPVCHNLQVAAHDDNVHVVTGQNVIDVLHNDVICQHIPATLHIIQQGQFGNASITTTSNGPKVIYETNQHNAGHDVVKYRVSQIIDGQTQISDAWLNLQLN